MLLLQGCLSESDFSSNLYRFTYIFFCCFKSNLVNHSNTHSWRDYIEPMLQQLRKHKLFAVGLLTTGTIIAIATVPEPAHAVFFDVEPLVACFPQAESGIRLIFGILRAILIIYTAAQSVAAVYQISRGESPLPLMLPMLAVFVVVAFSSIVSTTVGGCI